MSRSIDGRRSDRGPSATPGSALGEEIVPPTLMPPTEAATAGRRRHQSREVPKPRTDRRGARRIWPQRCLDHGRQQPRLTRGVRAVGGRQRLWPWPQWRPRRRHGQPSSPRNRSAPHRQGGFHCGRCVQGRVRPRRAAARVAAAAATSGTTDAMAGVASGIYAKWEGAAAKWRALNKGN